MLFMFQLSRNVCNQVFHLISDERLDLKKKRNEEYNKIRLHNESVLIRRNNFILV